LGCCSRGRPAVAGPATHAGVILDATFSSRANRDVLRNECEKTHVRFQVVELDADRSIVERRLRSRNEASKEVSDARLEDLEKLNAAYEPPSELGPDLITISANNSAPDTAKAVLRVLTEKQFS
jgi:predicted kinase